MSVWILLIFTFSNTPAVIDNIASYEECNRVAAEVRKHYGNGFSLRMACVEVKKYKS